MPDPTRPLPHSLRWTGFDYSSRRSYFVTICTANRQPILSRIDERCRVRLLPAGLDVITAWESLPDRFPHVALLDFVVMPDHVHGIIDIHAVQDEPDPVSSPAPRLGSIVGAFKSLSARAANQTLGRKDVPFRQRGYHDRVIRSDDELERFRWYVDENPARWAAARYSAADEQP